MQKYEIMDVIDEGAYGIVWKAVNKDTGTLVAIKEFKESDQDQLSRRTIQRQIKMLKMLKGDFVVNIKEAFKKKGKIYLIFQHFQHNLLNLIQKYEQGLDAKLINSLVYKIIKCLQYLHSKNIIHRDVKPQNLLLNQDYTILKICDFGFARFMPEREYDLTEYVATRWYRSPQLLVGQPYGKAADLWAVGCMIGELVDGQPMFPGDDQIDQIYLINKLVGGLTSAQHHYFSQNPKFQNIQLPEVVKDQTLDIKYLGRIQKNALSFMKACLKMNPADRITIEQALKHPYLINLSLQDNQFTNDEQNLLHMARKNPVKNQSKVSLNSVRNQQERSPVPKTKIVTNNINNSLIAKKSGLKLEGGSLNQRELPNLPDEAHFQKKKSHNNLQTMQLDEHLPKSKSKKLSKVMSQQKNVRLNFDVNLKINLKINQKRQKRQKQKDVKELIEGRLQSKLNLNHSKNKLLPEIKNNSKGMRYHLNIRHQKTNQLISVIGESKQLIKGSKVNLNH